MLTINVSEGKLNSSQRNNEIPRYVLYETKNLINGKIYVGQHTAYSLDDGYLGSGKVLGRAFHKYGKSNFKRTILKFCSSLEELLEEEAKIVTLEFCQRNDTYNLIPGGNAGMVIGSPAHKKLVETKNSPEGRLRASDAAKEVSSRPEVIERQSKLLTKQWEDPKFIEIRRNSNLRYKNEIAERGRCYLKSEEGLRMNSDSTKRQWENTDIGEKLANSRRTPEYRLKKSLEMKKRFSTPESRRRLALSKTKFIYHTPFGSFNLVKDIISFLEQNEKYTSVSLGLLRHIYNPNFNYKVTGSLIERLPELSKTDIGKTPEEIGFYKEAV